MPLPLRVTFDSASGDAAICRYSALLHAFAITADIQQRF